MVARYNADLANNFGNLANRVLNMAVNYCDGVVPDARADGPLVEQAAHRVRHAHRTAWHELDFSSGFGAVWDLIRDTNSYIEDQQPWKLHKAGDAAAVAGGARRLPRGAAGRRAARVAADPARRRRALAPARPPGAARGRSACPRRRRGAAACPRAPRSRRARRSSPASTADP